MAVWQYALLALGVAWGLQSAGVWVQMRHYSGVFTGVTEKYNDGFVGAGHVRGGLRPGAIALLVVDREGVVRRLLLMSGWSVFAKFRRVETVEGGRLADLSAPPSFKINAAEARAVKQAIEQVDRVSAAVREKHNDIAQPALGEA